MSEEEEAAKPRRKTPTRSRSGEGSKAGEEAAKPRRKSPMRSKSGGGLKSSEHSAEEEEAAKPRRKSPMRSKSGGGLKSSEHSAASPRRKSPMRSKSGGSAAEAKPRRKPPMRSKSGDGLGSPSPRRPAPYLRSKSFDDSGDRLKEDSGHRVNPYGLDSAPSMRDMFQTATDASKRGLLSTADSFKNTLSKRNLLSTADSLKNVVASGASVVASAPEQAVKLHNFLLTKPAKARHGAIPITALSSRNVMAEQKRQRNPLTRALSMEREPRGRGGGSAHGKSRGARSMSPHSNSNHKRRAGRKPVERTLTPKGTRRKQDVEDDDSNHLAIM